MIKYLIKQAKSFKPAFNGLWLMMNDHNAWIHIPAAVLVLGLAYYFEVNKSEWLWLLMAIFTVWILETVNTAIEKLVDLVQPDFHPMAGRVKDIAAGAVLLATIFAIIIGIIIFYPYLHAQTFLFIKF